MHVRTVFFIALITGTSAFIIGRHGADPRVEMPSIRAVAQDVAPAPPSPGISAPPAAGVAPPAAPAAQARPGAANAPKVDESALRYFAAQGDTRRVEAEVARLRALYPDWSVPADLNAPAQVGDPQLERMWKLFTEGKYGEVRAAIATRSAGEPGWQAPADLTAQLDRAEAAQRLFNAADAKQWDQVVRIATENPALLTCSSIDTLWRVAEAFAGSNRAERARDVFSYILTNCTDAAERLATMQKALELVGEPAVEALLVQEKGSEFAPIRDDLARRRIGRAAEDPKLTVSADDLRRLEPIARAAATPDDPILLGFYTLHHNEAAKAVDWFKLALSRNGGAKAAEGVVLALGAVDDFKQAEEIGSQWLEAGPANRKAYLDVATALIAQMPPPRLDQPVVTRIARTIGTDRYAPGAQGMGWYAYNSGQIAAAETWFETALAWDPEQEPAAYGLALTRQRLRDTAGLRAVAAQWGRRSDRIAALLDPRRRREVVDPRQPDPRQPVAPSASREPVAAERTIPSASREPVAAGRAMPYDTREPMPVERPLPTRPVRTVREIEPEPRYNAPAERLSTAETTASSRPSAGCGGGGSAGAALARGWCLLNLKRPVDAVAAFEQAARTGRGQVVEDALAGKVYAQLQRGLTAQAGVTATSAPVSRTRRRELSSTLLAERFYALYEAKNYNQALITLEERRQYAPEDTNLMMLRGWSYFNLGRYGDARRVFRALYRANNSSEALGGLSAIDDATRINRY